MIGTKYRLAGTTAIASGVIGIVAVGCLIAYLLTEAHRFMASGVMPPLGAVLITSNYVGVMLQSLAMIPVALALHDLARQRSPQASRAAALVGITALLGVAVLRLLLLVNPAVSDILFMAPMGFVGVWLIVINSLPSGALSRALRITGALAGLGLAIVGVSFFFLGGLAALTDGPFAYANDVDFHIGIAVGGIPGFMLYPVWALQVGRKLLAAV